MFLGIQKNSRGAEGKNKKTPDPFSDSQDLPSSSLAARRLREIFESFRDDVPNVLDARLN